MSDGGPGKAFKVKSMRQRPHQAPGRHCPLCDGPVTSQCFHTKMTARARRRMADREKH